MNLPTSDNVLGNFDNQRAKHFQQQAHFFTEGDKYKATIKDTDEDKGQTFTVKYTFGHDPLQQYLVETQRGLLQVLPFAWDTRKASEGGQRWYHLYTHAVDKNDRLHWRQALQNWNGMCADCHSDELKRNYEVQTHSFATEFSGINVGCVSCHGVDPKVWGDAHPLPNDTHLLPNDANLLPNKVASQASGLALEHSSHQGLAKQPKGHWRLQEGDTTVSWSGEARDNSFMDTCFACHALRAPLTDGFTANTPFLDNFSPQLVTPPNYHADGQIKEEVYVYGSFLQSKMYQQGVNCLDCHDAHTMKVKIEGNGLCLQCHTSDTFNTPAHHRHPINSEGALCVNCHMPDEIYMGVDARRDHSFKIPRPDLSDQFELPNACIACHSDESNQWAANAIEQWHGKADELSPNRQNLLKLRHGQSLSLQAHLLIAYDTNIDVISRASAIQMLEQSTNVLQASHLRAFVASSEDLLKLAAARVAHLVADKERVTLLAPLLSDSKKAIRTEAARQLISLELAQTDVATFKRAFTELIAATQSSAWRGEGRVNLANIWLKTGEPERAEAMLVGAKEHDPFFPTAYVNLADIYRAQAEEELVAQVLELGLQRLPESAEIHYSYGLHKVREKQLPAAIELFANSMRFDPQNPTMAYTYVLAIDGLGDTQRALNELKQLVPKYQNRDQDLIELGLYLSQKVRSRQDFTWFQQRKGQ